MAVMKLSAIASGTAPASTDQVVGVQSGSTDVLFTIAQLGVATSNSQGILFGLISAAVNAAGTGAVPGDIVAPTGGTISTQLGYLGAPKIVISSTKIVSIVLNAGGTGGTPGPVTITGTTGTGTLFTATGTINGGGVLQSSLTIATNGHYLTNPTSLTVEPVTGGGLVGASVTVVMGADSLYIQQTGSYSTPPILTANAQSSTTGAGTGLTMNLVALPISSLVIPVDQQTGSSVFFGASYGYKSLAAQTTGNENTAFGWQTLSALTSGQHNAMFGTNAGGMAFNGSFCTAIGCDAMRNSTTPTGSTAVGNNALKFNNNSQNTGLGFQALQGASDGSSSGTNNTSLGYNALSSSVLSSAANNTFVGANTGTALTSANQCTIVGSGAGPILSSGGDNTYIGYASGAIGTTGSQNTGVGSQALNTMIGSSGTTAVGYKAFFKLGGSDCVAVGNQAGQNITSGTQSIIIGSKAVSGASPGAISSAIIIGYSAALNITSGTNLVIGTSVAATLISGTRNIIIGTSSNTDATSSAMSDTFVVGASTGSTPWLTGSLVAASMTALFGGTLGSAGFINSAQNVDSGYGYVAPTTGATVTLSSTDWHTIIDPAGALLALTVQMPASPADGQLADFRVSQAITTLTVSPNAGQSVVGGPAAGASVVGVTYNAIYRAANTTWYF